MLKYSHPMDKNSFKNKQTLSEAKYLNLFKIQILKRFSKRTIEKFGITKMICEHLPDKILITVIVNNCRVIYGKNNSNLKKIDKFIDECKSSIHELFDLRIKEVNIWEIDKQAIEYREYLYD